MSQNNKIKELYNYEIPLDIEMEWSRLEKKLDKPKKRRGVIWILRGGIVLALVMPLLIYFGYSNWQVNKHLASSMPTATVENYGLDQERSQAEPKDVVQQNLDRKASTEKHLNQDVSTINDNSQAATSTHAITAMESDDLDISKSSTIYAAKSLDEPKVNQTKTVLEKAQSTFHDMIPKEQILHNLEQSPLVVNIIAMPMKSATLEALEGEVLAIPSLNAYNNDESENALPQSLYFNFGLGKSIRRLSGTNKDYLAFKNKVENPLESYNTSLQYGFNLSKHLLIKAGVQYSQSVDNLDYTSIVENREIIANGREDIYLLQDGSTTTQNNDLTVLRTYDIDMNVYNRFYQLGIPVDIEYRLGGDKLNYFFSTGIHIPILTGYEGSIIGEEGLPAKTDALKSFEVQPVYSLTYQIGLEKKIGASFNIRGGIIYQHALSDSYNTYGVDHSYSSLSLNLGLSYNIR